HAPVLSPVSSERTVWFSEFLRAVTPAAGANHLDDPGCGATGGSNVARGEFANDAGSINSDTRLGSFRDPLVGGLCRLGGVGGGHRVLWGLLFSLRAAGEGELG